MVFVKMTVFYGVTPCFLVDCTIIPEQTTALVVNVGRNWSLKTATASSPGKLFPCTKLYGFTYQRPVVFFNFTRPVFYMYDIFCVGISAVC
jgi:hypothetical protein